MKSQFSRGLLGLSLLVFLKACDSSSSYPWEPCSDCSDDFYGQAGSRGEAAPTTARYHPPPGFEDCEHAKVRAVCESGWCTLPASCFVAGFPESERAFGRAGRGQTAITLTNSIEMQQEEMSRKEWEAITGTPAPGPDDCTDPECPVAMVSWWDAVHAANLLSAKNKLIPCYSPVGCVGSIGQLNLECTGVVEPDKSVYECEGYRLPTKVEAQYATRAGTISTFYSGDVEVADTRSCEKVPALETIAWYCFNSGGRPHIGGGLRPNEFGLHDLIGNLGEWLNDAFPPTPRLEESVDPLGEILTRPRRVVLLPDYTSRRRELHPLEIHEAPWDTRSPTTGFRLVRTLTPNSPPDGAAGASNK